MDHTLQNVCRITGITKTPDNASDFVTCPNCQGITHKSVLVEKGNPQRGEIRCSYCGEPLPGELANEYDE